MGYVPMGYKIATIALSIALSVLLVIGGVFLFREYRRHTECQGILGEIRAASADCDTGLSECEELLDETRASAEDYAGGLSSCADLVDRLAVIAYPRNFHSVDELAAWLEYDDTDEYPCQYDSECAFRLQESSRGAGFYMGMVNLANGQVVNVAVVEGDPAGRICYVDPLTDNIQCVFSFQEGVTGEVSYETSH